MRPYPMKVMLFVAVPQSFWMAIFNVSPSLRMVFGMRMLRLSLSAWLVSISRMYFIMADFCAFSVSEVAGAIHESMSVKSVSPPNILSLYSITFTGFVAEPEDFHSCRFSFPPRTLTSLSHSAIVVPFDTVVCTGASFAVSSPSISSPPWAATLVSARSI